MNNFIIPNLVLLSLSALFLLASISSSGGSLPHNVWVVSGNS